MKILSFPFTIVNELSKLFPPRVNTLWVASGADSKGLACVVYVSRLHPSLGLNPITSLLSLGNWSRFAFPVKVGARENLGSWKIGVCLDKVKNLLDSRTVSVSNGPRTANSVAHSLAQDGLSWVEIWCDLHWPFLHLYLISVSFFILLCSSLRIGLCFLSLSLPF